MFDETGALSSGGWTGYTYNWQDENGNDVTNSVWYYANADGTAAKGWKYIGGKWYYFYDYYPQMATGTATIDGKSYVFNKDGSLAGAGWVDLGDGRWGYANANGESVPGWKRAGNNWYYINKYGSTATLSDVADGTLNLFNDEGVWTGAYKTPGWKSIVRDDYTYWFYINADGTAATGWKAIGGKWYWFNEMSGIMATGGARYLNDNYYLFGEDGALITEPGWNSVKNSLGDTHWYYIDSEGICKTGWQKIGGNWYFFDADMYAKEERYNSTWYIDGERYYFDENGILQTGWIEDTWTWTDYEGNEYSQKNWYYASASGTIATGWAQIGGKWYYFGTDGEMHLWNENGLMWRTINGIKYLFDENGAMQTGWIKETRTDKDYEGNVLEFTNWYYADASGALAEGERTIDGTKYLFDRNGRMITRDWGMYYRYKGVQYELSESGAVVKSFKYAQPK
ncbi:MAG: hypothetical protein J5928_02535 [Firmicutes bacterium]|nr:hypothetical protein [Bacillota bacterium]